jgi:hypothetical protein
MPILNNGKVKLRNLIPLRKVRVKIILPRKTAVGGNISVGGKAQFNGKFHHPAV